MKPPPRWPGERRADMTLYVVELAPDRWLRRGGGEAATMEQASPFGSEEHARRELEKAGGMARYPEAMVLEVRTGDLTRGRMGP